MRSRQRTAKACWVLFGFAARLIVAICCGAVVFHKLPVVVAKIRLGSADAVPTPPSWQLLRQSDYHQRRVLGRSRFARQSSYYADHLRLSEHEKAAYLSEGYLILRGLLPEKTVDALKNEILEAFGTVGDPYTWNAWLENDGLLDFFTFGPCAVVASQLFGGSAVHLLQSYHHFHGGAVGKSRRFSYDVAVCEDGYPPASATARTKLKFYIPLYADKSLRFVNQSATEALLSEALLFDGNASSAVAFRFGKLPSLHEMTRSFDQARLDRESFWPRLEVGDAIVHSPCLLVRTTGAVAARRGGGRPRAFVAPSYGPPDSKYLGSEVSFRQCDSGINRASVTLANAPPIKDVPRPHCYPRVFPPPDPDVRYLHFRRGSGHGPFRWYLASWRSGLLFAASGAAGSADFEPAAVGEPPTSHVLAGSTTRARGVDNRGKSPAHPESASGHGVAATRVEL
eukprot:gnl/TRDRNA2_/TRDRNA2_128806_c0_seq1.p1 gnl/TRDRNA2_/TRDRNA2_128806_c0~~gnl/TRDRNA2_/TRDRNA2_128806_c0_seq1.p1  ORF type:complete len:454 (-),score=24.85 gnl/TRDRNA2_/TRDRNA2_128806_c0_seq1:30-1391(-)